jgi:hypothetical protein
MSECPHCKAELSQEFVTHMLDESKFSFTITPNPGSLMMADMVGGVLTNLDKLMAVSGKSVGIETKTLIERIDTDENGAIIIRFIATRAEK